MILKKHRIIKLLTAVMLLTAPLACSKKTQETQESPAQTPVPAPVEQAPVAEIQAAQPLIAPDVVVEETPVNIRQIAPIHAPSFDSLKDLEPEKLEETVLKAFERQSSPQADELKTLKERAAVGDDEAKEAFIKLIFKRPQTDPEYKTAIQYLTSIREYKDADILFQRGRYEFSRMQFDSSAKDRAIQFLKMAAERNHEEALVFLLQNSILEQRETALEKLENIYEQRAQNGDAKALYDWARLLEFAPPTEMKKSEELLKKSADAGYGPAQFTRAMSLMDSNWDEALSLIKKSALSGYREAWLFQANLYALAAFSDNVEEANQLGLVTINEEQLAKLKAEVNASGDPKHLVIETARKASGFDEACAIMEAIASNDDNAESTVKARKYAIECREKFVAAVPSRDACDRAYDQMTYAAVPEVNYEQFYTPEQRQKMGEIIMSCYQNALDNGDDYPHDTPFVDFSTALQIAVLYSGESRLPIEPDHEKELAYLVYGATHGDIFSQLFLATDYDKGKYVAQNTPRSCYWAQRAAGSHICANFCTDEENGKASVCAACVVINDLLVTCKQIAESEKK